MGMGICCGGSFGGMCI